MIGIQGWGVYFWSNGQLAFSAFFADKRDAEAFADIPKQQPGEIFPMKFYTTVPAPRTQNKREGGG